MKRLYRHDDIKELIRDYEQERDEQQNLEPIAPGTVLPDPEFVPPSYKDLVEIITEDRLSLMGIGTPAEEYVLIHRHQCPSPGCGVIWAHRRPYPSCSDSDFAKAHRCPRCGMEQRTKLR